MSKIAFVLEGGGAKGAFQIGVMKKLSEQGITPEIIYGTSVGALNACGYATNGIDETAGFWQQVTSKSAIVKIRWLYWIFTLGIRPTGFYSTQPLKDILYKYCDLPHTFCKIVVSKVNLTTGALEWGKTGDADILESVLSSATIPTVMEPNGDYVDGGVRTQVPLLPAVKDGYTDIYVILTNPVSLNCDPYKLPWYFRWFNVLNRTASDILSKEVLVAGMRSINDVNTLPQYSNVKLTVFAPDVLLLDTLDFSQDKIQPAYKQGYEAVPLDLNIFKNL